MTNSFRSSWILRRRTSAIVRRGVYEGMLRADFGERAIIRKLFSQAKRHAKSDPTIEIPTFEDRPKTDQHEEP
jgi:hypothetical protein